MSTLQGYVEWHIANTLRTIAVANGMPPMDIILLAGLLVFVITGIRQRIGGGPNVMDTLVKLFTIITVNTSAKYMVDVVTKKSSFDIFSALFILTIMLQAFVTFYLRVLKDIFNL
jgi:hypothetical protein